MRLAGNWRNLFLWPCSCRVCYMFEVRAPLRLLLFFIFEKKMFFFLLLPSAAALSSSLGAVVSTAPKRPLTFAPRARRSNARFNAPSTPPPLASPTAAIPLVHEAEHCAAELESAPFSCFKCLFSSPPATRPLSHSVLFSSANETLQLARTKKRMKRQALKVNCHLLHHLPSAGTWCWSVKLKRTGAGLEIHAASSPCASVSVVFDKNNGRLSEYRPSGSD